MSTLQDQRPELISKRLISKYPRESQKTQKTTSICNKEIFPSVLRSPFLFFHLSSSRFVSLPSETPGQTRGGPMNGVVSWSGLCRSCVYVYSSFAFLRRSGRCSSEERHVLKSREIQVSFGDVILFRHPLEWLKCVVKCQGFHEITLLSNTLFYRQGYFPFTKCINSSCSHVVTTSTPHFCLFLHPSLLLKTLGCLSV